MFPTSRSLSRTLQYAMLIGITTAWLTLGASQAQEKQSGPTDQSNLRMASSVYPLDAVVDNEGTVWVVDRNAPGVWSYKDSTLKLEFPGAKKFREPLNSVRAIALNNANHLFAGDPSTREVYQLTSGQAYTPIASKIPGIPMDLAFAKDGTLFIADVERRVVWKKGVNDPKPVVFSDCNPRGLFVDSTDRLWVVSQNAEQLQRFSLDGKREVIVDKRTFEFPHQVVVDAKGTAWVSDGYKKAIWRIEEGKSPSVAFEGEPLQNPVGLFLHDGKLGIVDPHVQAVFLMSEGGKPELWFKVEIKK